MINIYLDTTGSMTEIGKDSAVLYIAKSIQDYCNFKAIENYFYGLDGEKIDSLASMKFSNDIKNDFNIIMNNSILVSDGLIDFEDEKIFDISISVGIDADLYNLKKISQKVFTNDEILSALEYLIFNNDLLENSTEESEEDEDEW